MISSVWKLTKSGYINQTILINEDEDVFSMVLKQAITLYR